MANLHRSLNLSFSSLHPPSQLSQSHLIQHLPFKTFSKPTSLSLNLPKLSQKQTHIILKATENGAQTDKDDPENSTIINQQERSEQEISEIGAEIKKVMKEEREKGDDSSGSGGFMSGVVEEIGQIEWPEFGKVVGTTGVVLGVIAGSSVVLLTVNGVLAELSDRVFAGKGVQDLFGG